MMQHIAAVRCLLADPARWTRELDARDAFGRPIDPCDDTAESFCVVGAFLHLANPEIDELRAWLRLADAAAGGLTDGRCRDVYSFNDQVAGEHSAVLRLLDRMAELAPREAGPLPPRREGVAWPLGQGRWRASGWPI